MACPALPVRFLQQHAIETATGIGVEVVHNPLGRNLRLHHRVHMIGAHMGWQQALSATHAHFLNGLQNGVATDPVQDYREPATYALARQPRARNLPPASGFQAHCDRDPRNPIRSRAGGIRSRRR